MSGAHRSSNHFGEGNVGVQVGQHYGTLNVNHGQSIDEQFRLHQQECHRLLRITSGSGEGYEWYKNRIEERVNGTCEWFLNHETYLSWHNRRCGPLLVSADPGCGKSVLAKYLVDHELGDVVCYFFFKDQDQCTEKQALCALLHQLFTQVPSLIAHALPTYQRNGEKFVGITHLLWEIFIQATKDPRAGIVTIVIDAMDECNRTDLQNLIRSIRHCPHVKWLLTCRPYQEIITEFLESSILYIPGEDYSEQIGTEVNLVIEHRVQRLSKQFGLNGELTGYILQRLLAIQHRTYLWVHLVFHHFKQGFRRTVSGLKELIDTMPLSVMEAYEKTLRKSTDEKRARAILAIVLVAKRPLTLREVNIATSILSVRLGELDLEDDEHFGKTLRDHCGLLISIHQTKVYFLHQTVRDFLTAENSSYDPMQISQTPGSEWLWRNSILLPDASKVLLRACLNFLNAYDPIADYENRVIVLDDDSDEDLSNEGISVETFSDGEDLYYATQERLDELFLKRPFFGYSSTYWTEHFGQASITAEDDSELVRVALTLCTNAADGGLTWFSCHLRQWRLGTPPKNCTALMVASFMGLTQPVKVLLQKEDPNRTDDSGKTALFYACRQGNYDIARLLIASFAFVNHRCYNERSALFEAVSSQNVQLIEFLLENGAEINVQDRYGSVLHEAVRYGRDDAVVRLLLNRGVDVDSQNWDGETALHHAVRNQNHAATKLLLEHGANVNLQDRIGEIPLHDAVLNQNQTAIRLLLAHGADVNVKAQGNITPLQLAHRQGLSSVAFLLNKIE